MPEFEAIESGKTGEFFREGSVEDLAVTIDNWTGNLEEEREMIRVRCYKKIERFYNPEFQVREIKKALEG